MKVLIIDFYYSTSNVGGLRWRKFAKYLPSVGIEPIILTSGSPDMDDDNVFHVPFLFQFAASHGFAYGRDDSLWGKVKRFIRGNFFIPDPRRLWFSVGRASDLVKRFDVKLVITTGPPHSVHLVGLELKKRLKIKWIADFRDPWEMYWFKDLYLTPLACIIHGRMWSNVLMNADKIIQVEDFVQPLVDPVIISNCFDLDDFRGEVVPGDEFVYVGSLTDRALLPPVRFKHIHQTTHEIAIREMRKAGYLLVAYPADVIPSKIYEYLASGRPILSYGIRGKGAELIERCGAGRHYENYQQLKEDLRIREVISDKGVFKKINHIYLYWYKANHNKEEIEKYNVKNVVKQLAEVICNVNAV